MRSAPPAALRAISLTALLAAGACGASSSDTSGPVFALEGDCAPAADGTPINLGAVPQPRTPASCFRLDFPNATPNFTVLRTQAEYDARRAPTDCFAQPPETLDFTRVTVLLHGGTEAKSGYFVERRFLVERADAIELGLHALPSGSPLPAGVLAMPHSDKPVVARRCRSVCVDHCDEALP